MIDDARFILDIIEWLEAAQDFGSEALEFLFVQAVFKAHQNRCGNSINVTVFQHGNHSLSIHRLACEELEILKSTKNVLHHVIDIFLEHFNLIGSFLF